MEIMDRNINATFMLPVSEKYNELGTMVMGKIESGLVKKGDTLLLMPNKVRADANHPLCHLHTGSDLPRAMGVRCTNSPVHNRSRRHLH
jgi:translation elongation factor EF-1alpha